MNKYILGFLALFTTATFAGPIFDSITSESSITLQGTTATTVPYLDGSKVLTSSSVTPTELGYLSGTSSSLQTQLDAKVPNSRTISTTSPLSGGGDLSANRTLSIADAAADGATKGAASFTASDFNASSGNISLDYTNGQAASGSTKGFLTSADWTTFNSKQAAGNYITALTGDVTASGPGSASATIANDTVTFAKMQNISTNKLLGRSTASSGDIEEISLGSGLTLSGGTLSASGTVAGSDTQIQFNDGNVFGADSNFVWDKTADSMGIQTTPQAPLHVNSSTGTGINDVVSGSATLIAESLPSVPTGSISQIAEFAFPTTGNVTQDLGGTGFIANGQSFDYRLSWVIIVNGTYYVSSGNQVVSYTDTINDASTPFANSISWSSPPTDASHILIERQVNGGGYTDSILVEVASTPFSDGNFSGSASVSAWPTYYQDTNTAPNDHNSGSSAAVDVGSGNLSELGITVLMEVKNAVQISGTYYTSTNAATGSFDDTGTGTYNAQMSWSDGGGGSESVVRMSRDGGSTWTYKLVGNSTGPYTFTDETNDSTAETAWGNPFSNYAGTTFTFRVHGRGTGGSGSPAGATIYSPTYNTYSTTIPPGGTKYILKHDLSSVPAGGYKALAPNSSPAYGLEGGQSDEPFFDPGYTTWANGTTITPNSYGFSGTDQNRSYKIYSSASGIYSVTPLTVTTSASGGTKYASLSWSLPSGVTTVKILRSINGGAYDAAKIVSGTSTTDDSTDGNWNASTTVTPTSIIPSAVRIDRANASVSDGTNLEIINTVGSGTRYSTIGFGVAADANSPSTLQSYIQSSSSTGYLSVVAGQLEGYATRGGTQLFRLGANYDLNLNKSTSANTNIWGGATPGTPAIKVDSSTGMVGVYTSVASAQKTLAVTQRDGNAVGLTLRQFSSSPGANLAEFQTEAGGITGSISPIGRWTASAGASASDPGLRFTGNTTSGFWSVTTSTIGIAAGGSETARWNTTGLSIKTTAAPTAKLHIASQSTSASSAPIKLGQSASLMSTPEAGAIEATTSFLTYTTSTPSRTYLLSSLAIPTSGRVPYAGTGGFMQDTANFTYSVDTLSPTKIAATTYSGNLTLADAVNIIANTSTGSKIGTATTQKLGFFNATPIVQPANTVAIDTALTNLGLRASGGTANFDTAISATNFAGSTWTPTLTNSANLDASTAFQCQYTRIAATVSWSCRFSVDPTLTVTDTQLGVSLPVSSNFGAVEDASGSCAATTIASESAGVEADATNDRMVIKWRAGDVNDHVITCSGVYQII